MNKLTIEQLEDYRNTYDKFDGVESNIFEEICNELINYKEIEKELGIDTIVLFKILKEGIWYKHYELKANPAYDANGDRCSSGEPYYVKTKSFNIEHTDAFAIRRSKDKMLFFTVGKYEDKQDLYFEDYNKEWSLDKNSLERIRRIL